MNPRSFLTTLLSRVRASRREEAARVEEALRESEERFGTAFRGGPLAMAITRVRDGRLVDANESFLELFGYARDEVIGRTTLELGLYVEPEDRARVATVVREQGVARSFDIKGRTKSGEVRDLLLSSSSVDLEGEPCFLNIAEDITERKRMEEALRESEERFSLVFHACPLAVSVSRIRDGLFIDVNQAFLDLLGYTREEAIGRTSFEVGVLVDPANRNRAVQAIRERGRGIHIESKIRTKSGEVRDIESSFVAIDLGGEPCFVTISDDVTERKRTDKALRESEERLRITLDGLLEGCQIIGFDWRYLYANDAVARHGRRTKDELLGHTMMEMYPGIEQTELFGYLRRCMEERIPHRMENQFVYPDGAEAWFELSIQPVPEGIFILSMDITEQKRMEEALRETEAVLRATLDATDEGIGVVDNDFRVLHFNARSLEMLGLPEELAATRDGEQILRFVLDQLEDPQAFEKRAREVMRRPEAFSDTLVLKDGRVFEHTGLPLIIGGAVAGRVGSFRDITQRVRAEEALQQAREELEERVEGEFLRKNPYGLTFREFTVLHLVAAGKADKEIAQELGISVLTASKHVANILGKMDAASRTEAGVRAVREGLIE